MRQEYPLSETTRNRLQQMQQQWELKESDLTSIETRIIAEIEAYRHKLQQYEQAFTRVIQQEYPLTEGKRNQLRQEQQNLGLKAGDIAPIESRITAEVKAYHQKLQQYEEVLTQTIQHEYPLSDEIREELKRYQGVLEIRDEDVARIEARVTSQDNASPSSDADSGSPEIQIQEVQADIIEQPILTPKETEVQKLRQKEITSLSSQREIVTPSVEIESTTQPLVTSEQSERLRQQ